MGAFIVVVTVVVWLRLGGCAGHRASASASAGPSSRPSARPSIRCGGINGNGDAGPNPLVVAGGGKRGGRSWRPRRCDGSPPQVLLLELLDVTLSTDLTLAHATHVSTSTGGSEGRHPEPGQALQRVELTSFSNWWSVRSVYVTRLRSRLPRPYLRHTQPHQPRRDIHIHTHTQ